MFQKTEPYILVLEPAIKDNLWGGSRLKEEFHIQSDSSIVAEAWMMSCNGKGPSRVTNGPLAGKALREAIFNLGARVLGERGATYLEFPFLVKLIDAKKDLSIQVHPDNSYARKKENSAGKTEIWYVLDAEEGAAIYYGVRYPVTKEELRRRIDANTLTEILHRVEVKKGDFYFIPPGTIHAIGAGIIIAEVQQDSDVTYRLYDYARKDTDGNVRELHIDKALDVASTDPVVPVTKGPLTKFAGGSSRMLCSTLHFVVSHLEFTDMYDAYVGKDTFSSYLFIDGKGTIEAGEQTIRYKKGTSLFVPAGTGELRFMGSGQVLVTSV